jgi:hypothetical protein
MKILCLKLFKQPKNIFNFDKLTSSIFDFDFGLGFWGWGFGVLGLGFVFCVFG